MKPRVYGGMGAGKRRDIYLFSLTPLKTPLPLKGKRGFMEGDRRAYARESGSAYRPPMKHAPSCVGLRPSVGAVILSQKKNRESGTDSDAKAPRNEAALGLKAAIADRMASLPHSTLQSPSEYLLSYCYFAPLGKNDWLRVRF